MKALSPYHFDLLADFLRKESGIVLKPEKGELVRAKLEPLAREWGYAGLDELVAHVHQERHNPAVVDALLNALTIKETSFFRDRRLFDVLRRRLIPQLAERPGEPALKLWSAACPTGQEAVSLAITLRQALAPELADRCLVMGTDVSKQAIARAREAVYSEVEAGRGLPPEVRDRFFVPVAGGFRPRDRVRDMIQYRELNLLAPDFAQSRFDVVLCRNVLIYFDEAGKRRALSTVYDRMASGGYLFTGPGEDPQRLDARFQRGRVEGVQCFRKPVR